jgi:flagellar basal-body rod protein FlgF
MDGPGIVGLSGQVALQQRLDATANNIANMNTAGFRGDRTLFQSFVSRLNVPGRQVAFVQDRATYVDAVQGAIESTGNPLDVAIDGPGFLAVERPGNAGRGYTRDGRLRSAPDRTLVDSTGRPVLDEGGSHITIPERTTKVEIRADGTLIATVDRREQSVARIGLFTANDIRAVRKAGDGLLDIPQNELRPIPQGTPSARGTRLVQAALEASSVKPVVEITNLTQLQRAYESLQRVAADDDSRLRKMIDAIGKP